MSVYMTEEEQLDQIKKWWGRHGNLITIILSIILFIVAGVRYWHWHEEKVNMQASNAYEQLMVAFSEQDTKAVRSYANQLINEYSNTLYADAARLTLAKAYVSREKYEKAREMLTTVVTQTKVSALKQVAKIRIARLYVAEKAYDKALSELASIDNSAYMPVINELKGDIYAATGNLQQAVLAYKEAIAEVRTNGMGNLFLEMKTNELAALTQSMKTDDSKLQAA